MTELPIQVIAKKTNRLIVLRVLTAVVFAIVTALLLWWYIDVLSTPVVSEPTNGITINQRSLALAFFIVIGLIIVGGIGYVVNLGLAITGLIISSIKYKKQTTTIGTLIYFIVFTALPILVEGIFFILVYAIG